LAIDAHDNNLQKFTDLNSAFVTHGISNDQMIKYWVWWHNAHAHTDGCK